MGWREQKTMLENLKRFEAKMDEREHYEYKMLLKRQIDEEDFDTLSMAKLKALHTKYYENRQKPNLDGLFKKND